MNELSANDYLGFLVEIKTRIRQAQYQALRAVNSELTRLYWDLGESIHQKQEGTRLRKIRGGNSCARPAGGVPWSQRLLGAEPLVHAPVLLRVSGPTKTPTIGWRNQLGQESRHHGPLYHSAWRSRGLLIGLGGLHCSRS